MMSPWAYLRPSLFLNSNGLPKWINPGIIRLRARVPGDSKTTDTSMIESETSVSRGNAASFPIQPRDVVERSSRSHQELRNRRKLHLKESLKFVDRARMTGLQTLKTRHSSEETAEGEDASAPLLDYGQRKYSEFFHEVFQNKVLPALLGKGVKERREIPEVLDWLGTVVEHTSLHGREDHPVAEILFALSCALAPNGSESSRELLKEGMQGHIHSSKRSTGLSRQEKTALENACVLGWCAEMLSVAQMLHDEIVHRQVFDWRMETECWFMRKDVGLKAISDANLLKTSVFRVLRKQFGKEKYFTALVDIFEQADFRAVVGQIQLELMRIHPAKDVRSVIKSGRFTMDNYDEAVWLRESSGTIYFPLLCAHALNGCTITPEIRRGFQKISRHLGWFRRCVTDYEDCFVVRSGEKHPRYESIRNGRCNWLAVEIIQLFNNTNAVDNLLDNYGANDDEKCRKIQELFASCGLSDVHKESVEYNSKEILKLLNAHVQLDGVRSVLEGILKGLMVMA